MRGALDIDAALAFLETRFGREQRGYAILAFRRPDRRLLHTGISLDSPHRWTVARRDIERHAPTCDTYLAVATYAKAPGDEGQRNKAMIGHVNALYCERDAAPLPPTLPLPTITVESSPGRYQDYWHLETPISVEVAERYIRRVARAVGIGNDAVDATRILRLPGTINHKPEYDRPLVRVVGSAAYV